MGAHLTKASPSERVEKVFALLIESGFVYCLLWVIVFCPPSPQSIPLNSVLQTFYLLSAYNVLPGAGTYIVNLVMLCVSVRIHIE